MAGMEGDIRTVDKLVDGCNATLDDRHMWLAPLRNTKVYAVTNREVAKCPNVVTVTFEGQVALGGVRLWNYTKTVERGVQELGIFCDGRLIYRGIIKKAEANGKNNASSIIFTTDEQIIESMRSEVVYTGGKEQDVVFINESEIVSKHEKKVPTSFEIERPLTSVVGYKCDLLL
eukprot:TRINITY_DN2273_c0_g1_i12.p1 TRINITY_DN2273_c0_g1~~TRINITY_DN2273_c0_g1_i12.p1  ORF type:complete len:174 (+),score=29.60 TRINITY_DN2273_c0_g1_i12:444-965(+)